MTNRIDEKQRIMDMTGRNFVIFFMVWIVLIL